MVGVNDMTVLMELSRSRCPGMVPLRFETDEFPISFNRILSNVYNINGSPSSRHRRLHTLRMKLEAQDLVYYNTENEMIILTGKGWGVVDGKK